MGGGLWGRGGRVELINGKGCSRRFFDFSSSFRGINSSPLESMSPASTASFTLGTPVESDGPLSGLVICVTGLSKETRKQVKEATERLGGQYSPHLHPRCTHLVVQSFRGHKFNHAIKHGPTNGLFLVTLSWFVDSIKRNVRLNESLYSINNVGTGAQTDDLKRLDQNAGTEDSSLPDSLLKHTTQPDTIGCPLSRYPEGESNRRTDPTFWCGQTFYVDVDVPAELRSKVTEALSEQGASLLSQWFVGSKASHVVCEGTSIRKYLGHSSYLVTPLWVLKSVQEKCLQRLVHLSADLARFSGVMLDTFQDAVSKEEVKRETARGNVPSSAIKVSHEERQAMTNLAKDGVRSRRNQRMQFQTCQTPIRPIMPSRLLDSISWSISEPTSKACIYMDSLSVDVIEDQGSAFFDAKPDEKESDTLFVNLSRPLTESQKSELIFKSHFLAILFPVDRFSELGPCSRTFFSNKGFTCLQVLDHIYSFYQENMSVEEIEVAIHTDSRHADRLRAAYCSNAAAEVGCVQFKRIDFLGSRKSFEMLKRVSGDNNSNVYELVIRA